ncbi:unnamed protein product [Prunus armeniaca]|uniref:Uncharacterized protein n=1 Tax=Prunus armeniaca TaxID=36596 RepID=A0A6J5VTU7_PRUAR|nr:unnamed protein product [Prunus armeniaca]
MAGSVMFQSVCCITPHHTLQDRQRTRRYRSVPVVFAAQSNFLKVVQTVWKVGRDGIEAGTNLVPFQCRDSVPTSIARVSVTVVALALSLFVLKYLLSTVFFVLATMGLVYFTGYEEPEGGGGTTPRDLHATSPSSPYLTSSLSHKITIYQYSQSRNPNLRGDREEKEEVVVKEKWAAWWRLCVA